MAKNAKNESVNISLEGYDVLTKSSQVQTGAKLLLNGKPLSNVIHLTAQEQVSKGMAKKTSGTPVLNSFDWDGKHYELKGGPFGDWCRKHGVEVSGKTGGPKNKKFHVENLHLATDEELQKLISDASVLLQERAEKAKAEKAKEKARKTALAKLTAAERAALGL